MNFLNNDLPQFSDIIPTSASRNIFDEIDAKVEQIKSKGITIYDCGVLDPAKVIGMPNFIYSGIENFIQEKNKFGQPGFGYPGNKGEEFFLQSAMNYVHRNFGVKLDLYKQINITNGSKTDEFIFGRTFLNPGDIVICPTPGYPAFQQGSRFISANVHLAQLNDDFLIDFDKIPNEIASKAKIIWINYPNSPTGKIASKEWLEKLVSWAKKYNIIIASDEAYVDFFTYNENTIKVAEKIDYYVEQKIEKNNMHNIDDNIQNINHTHEIIQKMIDENKIKHHFGHSILNITTNNVIAFFSLSKRSNLSSFRVGFCAGDARIISAFYKIKNMHDDGVPQFIQRMAANALNDDNHVAISRELYNYCRYCWSKAFNKTFSIEHTIETNTTGGLFLWQKTPENMSDHEFAEMLLEKCGIVVMPGSVFNTQMSNFVRLALSCDINFIKNVEKLIMSIK